MEDKAALVESNVGEDERCFDREFIVGVFFNIGSFPVFAVSGFFNYLLVVLLVIGKRKRETPDCCLAHFPDKEE